MLDVFFRKFRCTYISWSIVINPSYWKVLKMFLSCVVFLRTNF